MKRYWQAIALAAALMVPAGNAFAGNVQTDYDHSVNFTQYTTYSWGKVQTTDPFYVNRVQTAVNQQLQAKGWKLVPSGGAVNIFATDNVHDQKQIQTMYDGMGGGWGGGWGWGRWGWGGGWGPGFGPEVATTTTTDHNVGTLVIDLFDANSKLLLWRGMSTENLSSNDNRNTHQLDEDITKMFKTFPPKPGK
jgi:hypothetical protein